MSRIVVLLKRPVVLVGLLAVVLVGGGVVWWVNGDDKAEPLSAGHTTATSSPTPTTASSSTPKPKASDACEDADTRFNQNGEQMASLLPDCGSAPVTVTEEKKTGLGLGCGGTYPIILYKTDADDMKASVCGVTSSGEKLRVVIQDADGTVHDLAGDYDYTVDGFVAEDGNVVYTVIAYNGAIAIDRDGVTKTTSHGDWMSLDNENDD